MKSAAALRILGVDPGTLRLGYALVEAEGSTVRLLASGVLAAPAAWASERRLGRIAAELGRWMDEGRPAAVAMEASFFGKNAQSLIRLGEARGMVLALAGARGLTVYDYPPATVKKSVTGNGAASKEQVARVLGALLPGGADGGSEERADRTDAIAVAWCHVQQERVRARVATVTGLLQKKSARQVAG